LKSAESAGICKTQQETGINSGENSKPGRKVMPKAKGHRQDILLSDLVF